MPDVLLGLMQDQPLQISALIRHGATINGTREVVSRQPDATLFRYTLADAEVRARRWAKALQRLGIKRVIASPAWRGIPTAISSFFTPCPAWARFCTR